jgi:hypothetical protein
MPTSTIKWREDLTKAPIDERLIVLLRCSTTQETYWDSMYSKKDHNNEHVFENTCGEFNIKGESLSTSDTMIAWGILDDLPNDLTEVHDYSFNYNLFSCPNIEVVSFLIRAKYNTEEDFIKKGRRIGKGFYICGWTFKEDGLSLLEPYRVKAWSFSPDHKYPEGMRELWDIKL